MTALKHKPVPAISWTWDEGRYCDLWMIVHVLSGMICGCVIVLLRFPDVYAYLIAIIALAVYELGEMAYGIEEEPQNWLLDIVAGMLGFWFVYEKVLPGMTAVETIKVGASLLLFNGIFALLGWRAYRKRMKKEKGRG